MSGRRRAVLAGAILLVLAGAAWTLTPPEVRWRAGVVGLKLRGQLPDLGWSHLLGMLRPGSLYNLEPLLANRNLFRTIRNPHTSPADVAAGAEVFRAQCAACHEGVGARGPNLAQHTFRHGDSDWALFRTITRGVPGTAMEGRALPDRSVWQVVSFVRALGNDPVKPKPGVPTDGRPAWSPVTYARLLRADAEPGSWLTYSGGYAGHRYSRLDQITPENIQDLGMKWVFQISTDEKRVQATPLVVDAVMFLTEPPSNVVALDARTGGRLWMYQRRMPSVLRLCCERVNRGVAVLDDRVYVATLDAHLVALDASTGVVVWDIPVADTVDGYSITGVPLAVDGKILVGVSGGDLGARGFVGAYDSRTGVRVWRFDTVPGPGEPGHETWTGEAWRTGGAAPWHTGSFDPELKLVYWGVGNPRLVAGDGPAPGDSLFSNSVVALDADTGRLRWHFQFTPADEHDRDSAQIPVLIDRPGQATPLKLIGFANKNGFYYVLDRQSGRFLAAREFARQTWAQRIEPSGRPVKNPDAAPSLKGTLVYPGGDGAMNWRSPAYSPLTGLLYVPVLEAPSVFFKNPGATSSYAYQYGTSYRSMVRALSPETGEIKWETRWPPRTDTVIVGGLLSTAGGLIFGGDRANFFALDAVTGRELWSFNVGGIVSASPVSYAIDGQQFVTVAAGRTVFTFGLNGRGAAR